MSGHLDQCIYKYSLDNNSVIKLIMFGSIPYCLTWGRDILIAGNDYRVYFFNDSGIKLQHFEYSPNDVREFTVAKCNSSNDCVAIGNYNQFMIYTHNEQANQWEESCHKYIENYYSITALTWKAEFSCLVIGSLCGSLDVYEPCLKKSVYDNKYEITHLSNSQIILKKIENNKKMTIKTKLNSEIIKMNIYDDYVVLRTKETLILVDSNKQKYSEIEWQTTDKEFFNFDNPNLCLIQNISELAIIEFGNNEISGFCRSEYINNKTISARIDTVTGTKILAFLIDPSTILIQNLITQEIITCNNKNNIDFLDFNKNGNKLIIRDSNKQLFIYSIDKRSKNTLLTMCGFVQWVPDTNVLVAQDGKNLCVWYDIDDIHNKKVICVKGEAEEVRTKDNKVEVVMLDETGDNKICVLDNDLINISIAIESNDLSKAVGILDYIGQKSEYEMLWRNLALKALNDNNLVIAQQCYAAIGNYSKANYVKKLIKESDKFGIDNPIINAKILMLSNRQDEAYRILEMNRIPKEEVFKNN